MDAHHHRSREGNAYAFCLGAGHLAGPEGVVRMLRDAGYTVEQLKP
ncbi:MAG: TraB/GumN family protein [Bacteroidaceae bacterium]|nr:TraB/GumN family protein [Bacteroidaceae bacterium]